MHRAAQDAGATDWDYIKFGQTGDVSPEFELLLIASRVLLPQYPGFAGQEQELSDADFLRRLIPWLRHVEDGGEKVAGLERFPSREQWRTYSAEVRAAWQHGKHPVMFRASSTREFWEAAVAEAATPCDEPVQVPASGTPWRARPG
jgi:hypothetical protein